MVLTYYLIMVLVLVLCGFFSGSETGVYRLSRVRLRIGIEQGKGSCKTLFKLIKDGQGLILSLLLGNNLANYCLTSLVTLIILKKTSDHRMAEVYATAILTPIVFIFGELIPKNLFYYQADVLMPCSAWIIWFFDSLFKYSGAKAIIKGISKLMAFCFRLQIDTAKAVDVTQRHQVHQIIHETREEGLLSETQRQMMSRLIDVPAVSVGRVMIPLKVAEKVPLSSCRDDLLGHLAKNRFTRRLVYGQAPGDVLGYISILDILATEEQFENLQGQVSPIMQIKKSCSVIEAIDRMRNQNTRIGLVVDSSRRSNTPVGIITLTDLIEELMGELNA